MATFTQNNYDNFLTWQKVNGGLALTRLQARGIPACFEAYNLASLTFKQDLSITAGGPTVFSIWWSGDGYDFYYCVTGTSLITQKSVSRPYDISTVISTATKDVSAQDTAPGEIRLNAAGTKAYFSGGGTNDYLYQYTLTTAFDITTMTYDSKYLDFSAVGSFQAFHMSSSNIYIAEGANIYQYSWTEDDLSTAVQVGSVVAVPGYSFTSLFYRGGNNQKLYLTDTTNEKVVEYSLNGSNIARGTVTASATVATNPSGIYFDAGGHTMWIMDGGDDINEYWVGCP